MNNINRVFIAIFLLINATAIFSEDYECLLNKAMGKYKLLIEIYEDKAEMMFTYPRMKA